MEAVRASSEAWWATVRADPVRLQAWLRDQYRGEATAAGRIQRLRDAYAAPGSVAWRTLTLIAAQEARHAEWVGQLLQSRGEAPEVADKADRYWPPLEAVVADLASGCAVGAHAEAMRLARIETIVADDGAPADVRACFARILPQERFHERAFRLLAGDEARHLTAEAHRVGMAALGLVP